MFGAIIGDIVGSRFEYKNIKNKDFVFFHSSSHFTDDTVLTIAIADALLSIPHPTINENEHSFLFASKLKSWSKRYWKVGYGQRFFRWMLSEDMSPYSSFGNGAAMRVSPVAWYAKTLDETERLARISAQVSHNHPEGIKGAQAIAGMIYLARNKACISELKAYAEQYYELGFTLDEIRPVYCHNESAPKSIPQAIVAFLESTGFEDAIRNAISIGGDSDTIAAITGSIAEAYYGIPSPIAIHSKEYLPSDMIQVLEVFQSKYQRS